MKTKKNSKTTPRDGVIKDMSVWKKAVNDAKKMLSSLQTTLDLQGVTRKQKETVPLALTSESVESLNARLMTVIADEELALEDKVNEVMLAVVEELAVEDTVSEEDALEDEEEEVTDKEVSKVITLERWIELAEKQGKSQELVDGVASTYTQLMEDQHELFTLTKETIGALSNQVKVTETIKSKLDALEEQIKTRPRQASTSKETEVDQNDPLGSKALEQNLDDVPEVFKGMFKASSEK